MIKKTTLLPKQAEEMKRELNELKNNQEILKNEKKCLSLSNACSGSLNNTSSDSIDSNLLLEFNDLSRKIELLERLLKNSVVIREEETDVNFINIGTTFSCNIDNRKEITMTLVEVNGDPMQGLISTDSPLGKAVYKKTVGEDFSYLAPNGKNMNGLITKIHMLNEVENEKVMIKK